MRFSSGTSRWWIAAYLAVTLVCTTGWLVLGQRLTEQTGLRRQVWLANDFQGIPVINDVVREPTLDFLYDDRRLPRRFFSVRWSGFWYLPDDTDIELRGAGDDRLDVWIDDVLVIRRTPPADMGTQVATLRLAAGVHQIRVEYEQHRGTYNLLLHWAPQGGRAGPLPQHYLFAERPDDNDIRLAERTALLQHTVQIAWATFVVLALLWVTTRTWARHRIVASYVYILDNPSVALTTIAYGFAAWVFLKNAWVHEDAYIIFRSVEQVFAGNGPVWNPHERVQVFTSPLWFGVLVLSRSVSTNLYLNAIAISLALWLFTLSNIQRLAPNSVAFAIAVLLCTASTAIHDFTSSGLENVLAYALITYFLLQLALLPRDGLHPSATVPPLTRLCLAFGLIAVTRHDLIPLMLPPIAFLLWRHRYSSSRRQWWVLAAAALLPLMAWTLFSLVYYGFPWPNTAYAKLNTGVDRADLVAQGLNYLHAAVLHDAITPATIVVSLIVICFSASTVYRFVGVGILLNLAYVVSIGGDYMVGRFLSYACLAGVCLLILELPNITYSRPRREIHRQGQEVMALTGKGANYVLVVAVVATYAVAYHHTPVNCWRADPAHNYTGFGLESVRDGYAYMALAAYLSTGPEVSIWPNDSWAQDGLRIRESLDPVHVASGIGVRGYMAGTEKIIVDVLALGDPFLARLPTRDPKDWRSGHFRRDLPDGYVELLEATRRCEEQLGVLGLQSSSRMERLEVLSRIYQIGPPELNELYKRLATITQAEDLWSLRRLKTILLFNLGAYNHLAAHSTMTKNRPRGGSEPKAIARVQCTPAIFRHGRISRGATAPAAQQGPGRSRSIPAP